MDRFVRRVSRAALLLLGTASVSCQDPTEITLEITSDVQCPGLTATSIAAGTPGEIEKMEPATVTKQCAAGRIGSLVVTPAGGTHDDVSIRVVTGVGKSLDACVKDDYKHVQDDLPGTGCIVARRELAYIEHRPLLLPVVMEKNCIDVPCDPTTTCVGGRCVSAKTTCDGDRCGIQSKPDGGGGAGGADASSGGRGGVEAGGAGGSGGSDGHVDSGSDLDGGDASDSSRCPTPGPTLAGLTTSHGTVTPVFDPCTLSYSLTVDLVVQDVTVTPIVGDAGSEVRVNATVVGSATASPPVPLTLGTNSISIVVKSPAGTSNTYTLTVERTMALSQNAYVKSDGPRIGDGFGASIALSSDTLVTGKLATTGTAGDDGGSAYVFVRSGTSWKQEAVLKGRNTELGDSFGTSVAISGDTIAIGAYGESSSAKGIDGNGNDNGAPQSGAVYVFVRSGTSWAQQAYIKASNTDAGDFFGRSVTLAGDILAVGAWGESSAARIVGGIQTDNTAPSSGAVYIFVRSGTTWTQQAYVKASNADPSDFFGTRVVLSGDTLAVSAYGEDSATKGVGGNPADNSAKDSGAAYVFVRSGSTWTQQAYVKASNTDAGDSFGLGLSLSDDTLAVGAPLESAATRMINGNQQDNGAQASGAVYVFARSGTAWAQEAYVKASNGDAGDYFGRSVALRGSILAVGAYAEDSIATGIGGNRQNNGATDSGSAYLFGRSGTAWTELAYMKASNTDPQDSFGLSVGLSDNAVAIGAFHESSASTGVNGNQRDNSASQAGAVYIFQ